MNETDTKFVRYFGASSIGSVHNIFDPFWGCLVHRDVHP